MSELLASTLPKGFSEKITVDIGTGCWNWNRGTCRKGYGRKYYNGKLHVSHRAVWMLLRGEIADGMFLDHKCRNRACCNPEHLREVTPRQNVLENSENASARKVRQTHCLRGHTIDGLGLNGRFCRECSRVKARARVAARKILTPSGEGEAK